MIVPERRYFLFNWTIKRCNFQDNFYYISPQFKAANFGNSEWRLDLYRRANFTTCFLALVAYGSLSRNAHLDYRFELTNSIGMILKSSEEFIHILKRSPTSIHYDLIDIKDLLNQVSNCPENSFTVRCYMSYKPDWMSLPSSDTAFVNCEAETNIIEYNETFEWNLKFTNFDKWSASKRVYARNIPLNVTFKYIFDEILIEISSNIEDDWKHNFFCDVRLIDVVGNEIFKRHRWYIISSDHKTMPQPPSISKQHLYKAQCFAREEIRVRMKFTYEKSSKIKYLKDLKENVEAKNVVFHPESLQNANQDADEDRPGSSKEVYLPAADKMGVQIGGGTSKEFSGQSQASNLIPQPEGKQLNTL